MGSVLAILAATVAIVLQSRELREQRKELGAQRRELTLQREQLELQRQELGRNVLVRERIADTANYRMKPVERDAWMRHAYMTAWMRLLEVGVVVGHSAEDPCPAPGVAG